MCEEIEAIEIIKTAGPYVTATASFIAAVVVVALNFRNQLKTRKETYRQEIYKRMVVAYEEIYSDAFEFCKFYAEKEIHKQLTPRTLMANLKSSRQKYIIYLSPSVDKAIQNVINFDYGSGKPPFEPLNGLADAMKNDLGVKFLAEGLPEVLNVKIGKKNDKTDTTKTPDK